MTNLTKKKHSSTTVLQDIKSVNIKQNNLDYLIAHFSPLYLDCLIGKVKLSCMEMFTNLDKMAH